MKLLMTVNRCTSLQTIEISMAEARNRKKKAKKEETSNPGQQPARGPKVSPGRMVFVGLCLVAVGMMGFYTIPGLMIPDASGSKLINAFYCSVMTLTT